MIHTNSVTIAPFWIGDDLMNAFDIKEKGYTKMPLVALRGLVALPGMHLNFDAGRKKSMAAIDEAMHNDQLIFLVSQTDIKVDEPEYDDLYKFGTISRIKQVLKLPGDSIRVAVEGISRARMESLSNDKPYFEALITEIETEYVNPDSVECESLVRRARELFDEYASNVPKMPNEIMLNVMTEDDSGRLADYIASNTMLKYPDKQKILEEINPLCRLEKLLYILDREIEIMCLDRDISERVRDQIDRNQREYYLREQMKVIQNELGDGDNGLLEADIYKDKIIALKLDKESEAKLLKETDRLMKMPSGSHEGAVLRNYLDTCIELPWNKKTKDRHDIKNAEKILNNDHYGLTKVKERILEFLSVKALAPDIKGQILCFIGPPGVGKTSVAQSIARAMNRKFVRLSLGGVRDEAEIRGHRRTYVGSMPGRIINAVKQAGSSNPLILLDEIDKLGNDFRGDPASALLEVLDPEQNKAFRDHYIEVPFDLSDTIFITTANTYDTIPRPLLDRMEIIDITSYTSEEKREIAKRHLLPKQMKRHGLNARIFKLADDAIDALIEGYTKEAGVRGLERELASLCRKGAKKIVYGSDKKVIIKKENLEEYLGPKKFKPEELPGENQVGIVTGLAWTTVGGELLTIEVNVMDGTGKLELTGSLGDVMKESAKAAVSYIRSRANVLHIDSSFYKDKDIHIHVPEGAVPKDGPSAGITIATALVSELTGASVKTKIAMTGEITLRGRVLPIGGLKEKTMAAYKAGVKTVLIPFDNLPDLAEIDNVVKENINFIAVKDMDEVIKNALNLNVDISDNTASSADKLPNVHKVKPDEVRLPFMAQ